MNNTKSVTGIDPKTRIIVREGKLSIEIRTESDGHGGSRHCFYHPTQKDSNGTRQRRVHSRSLEIIKKLAVDVLRNCIRNQQTLIRDQFLKLSTVAMGRPMAYVIDPDSMTAADWKVLMSALNKEQLRWVALILSDIRRDEIKKLGPNNINHTNGLPTSVHIAP